MAQYVYTMNRVGKIVPPKHEILKDISLSFFPGAKIGVLGLNGAGKSTLLRIMAGVDKEYNGEARPMPGINIGYLPQEPELDDDKNVRETVEEALSEIKDAQEQLEAVYVAYAEPDADFDALAAEQARLEDLIEAADAFGATRSQKLIKIQLPLSLPTIMAGINQTIMLALSMVVIAAMIGADGLGSEVWRAIQRLRPGDGFEAGIAVVILAMLLDRITQAVRKK